MTTQPLSPSSQSIIESLIESARITKKQSSDILSIISPAHSDIASAFSHSWNILRDNLMNASPSSMEELDTFSTIIYKICCSSTQIKAMDSQLCDSFLKEMNNPNSSLFQTPLQSPKNSASIIGENHLNFVLNAKKNTTALLEIANPEHRIADEIVSRSWKFLNEQLCNVRSSPINDLADSQKDPHQKQGSTAALKTLSTAVAILYKLSFSYCRLKKIELDTYHFIQTKTPPPPPRVFTREMLEYIEKEFGIFD